jgi:hypothetical protein
VRLGQSKAHPSLVRGTASLPSSLRSRVRPSRYCAHCCAGCIPLALDGAVAACLRALVIAEHQLTDDGMAVEFVARSTHRRDMPDTAAAYGSSMRPKPGGSVLWRCAP